MQCFFIMEIDILAQKFYDYSSYIRGYSPYTIRRYKNTINFFCNFAEVTKIEEVTEEKVRALFLHGRVHRNWGANTFVCYHKSLLVFFRWCIDNKYMKDNPVENIEMPKIEKRLPPKLTKQEALRLLEVVHNYPYDYKYLRHRNHAIFSMFIFSGLRKKELLNLKLTDVDVDRKSTRLNSSHTDISRMPSSA